MNIAIIGNPGLFPEKKLLEFIFKLKQEIGSALTISTTGNNGVEELVKKACLKFEVKYKEFTPLYKPHSSFSVTTENQHINIKYHYTQLLNSYLFLLRGNDIIFIIDDKENPYPVFKSLISNKKQGHKCQMLQIV